MTESIWKRSRTHGPHDLFSRSIVHLNFTIIHIHSDPRPPLLFSRLCISLPHTSEVILRRGAGTRSLTIDIWRLLLSTTALFFLNPLCRFGRGNGAEGIAGALIPPFFYKSVIDPTFCTRFPAMISSRLLSILFWIDSVSINKNPSALPNTHFAKPSRTCPSVSDS